MRSPDRVSSTLTDIAEGSDLQQDVTYRAPVASADLKESDDDGNSYEIRACHDCLPWPAEVVLIAGEALVREWHAVEMDGAHVVGDPRPGEGFGPRTGGRMACGVLDGAQLGEE
ncbi:hypothetical protein ACWD64_37010 [Streptomyces antibioticus]